MRTYQNQNCRGQNKRGGYRGNYRNEKYERGRSRSRDMSYSGNFRKMTGIVVIVGQSQDQD